MIVLYSDKPFRNASVTYGGEQVNQHTCKPNIGYDRPKFKNDQVSKPRDR
jgi:hypothetical protein